MLEELTIERLSYGDEAVAHLSDGRVAFIEGACPGDRVRVDITEGKERFVRGHVTDIIEASPDRVDPRAPFEIECGTCGWQHVAYERQLVEKRDNIVAQLVKVAHVDAERAQSIVAPCIPSDRPWGYRNKLEFACATDASGFTMGYHRKGADGIVSPKEFPLGSHALAKAPKAVRGALRFSVPARYDAKALASAAEELDRNDDAIVSASDFFNMRGDWEGAWANEIGPVMEDLNSLEELVDTVTDEIKTAEARASRDAIMRWIRTQTDAIMGMRGQLRDGTTTPDEALAALDAISEQTRSCAVDVINASLDADTSEYAWKRRLRWQKAQTQPPEDDMAEPDGAYRLNGEFVDYDPSRTIRPNFSVPGVAELRMAGFGQAEGIGSVPVFVPLSMMNGRYYDEHSWTPSSSSSSSSTSVGSGSYGSSGGSFSGSGNSGSF